MLDRRNFCSFKLKINSSYVWESFKNPEDTILPTQVPEICGMMLSSQQAEGKQLLKGEVSLLSLSDGNPEID